MKEIVHNEHIADSKVKLSKTCGPTCLIKYSLFLKRRKMSLADKSDKFKFDKIYMVGSVVAAVAIYFLLQTTVGVGKVAAIAVAALLHQAVPIMLI